MADEQITKKELHDELGTQLGEFAEQVLLPAVERIVDEKVGAVRDQIYDYVDRKIEKSTLELGKKIDGVATDLDKKIERSTGEIISVIKGDRERDRTFKSKVIEIFRRNHLVHDEELLILEETMP